MKLPSGSWAGVCSKAKGVAVSYSGNVHSVLGHCPHPSNRAGRIRSASIQVNQVIVRRKLFGKDWNRRASRRKDARIFVSPVGLSKPLEGSSLYPLAALKYQSFGLHVSPALLEGAPPPLSLTRCAGCVPTQRESCKLCDTEETTDADNSPKY